MQRYLVALAFALSACEPGITLIVLLRSDLAPGVEVAEAEVLVDGSSLRVPLAVGDDLLGGFRLAELRGLTADPARIVEVRLRSADGAFVLSRTVVVEHRRNQSVVVSMSRSCREVVCSDGLTCHGGQCVDPRCDSDDPTCGESQCTTDSTCAPRATCATPRCIDGVCYYVDSACGPGEYCDLDEGCRAADDDDAGVDAEVDAGSDAGVDAGPPPMSRALYLVAGSSWREESFVGEGPTDQVLAAFTSGDEVVALTASQVFFLRWSDRTWIALAGRSSIFPELEGGPIDEATIWPDSAAEPRLRVFTVGGGWWDYRWTGWRRSGVFIEQVGGDALPDAWSSPEAPRQHNLLLALTDPANASGWVGNPLTPTCMGGPVRTGQHVFFVSTDGFGPASWPRSAFEPSCQVFLPSSTTTAYPPFMLADAPPPRSIHAGTFVDGSILLFVDG